MATPAPSASEGLDARQTLAAVGPHISHATSMHCRVGSGLTDAQQMQVRERLQPYLMPNTGKNWPKCYKVTGRLQERPDFWVKDPYQSLVLKASWAHLGYSAP